MTTKNLIQLIEIPDFRFTNNQPDISYADIACDCETKTISILDAIKHISSSIFELSSEDDLAKDKVLKLSAVISDLAELAIATNKISQAAAYLSGVKDGKHGA